MSLLRAATMLVLILIGSAIVTIGIGGLAGAQTLACAPVDQVVVALHDQYQEELVGDGVGPNGTRLLVFAHPDGDTWTVIGLLPDGRACPVASGTDWTPRTPTPPGSET